MKEIAYLLFGAFSLLPSIASAYYGDPFDMYGMMGYGGGEGGFFVVACVIVWTIVGILAGVWLWQNINKK